MFSFRRRRPPVREMFRSPFPGYETVADLLVVNEGGEWETLTKGIKIDSRYPPPSFIEIPQLDSEPPHIVEDLSSVEIADLALVIRRRQFVRLSTLLRIEDDPPRVVYGYLEITND